MRHEPSTIGCELLGQPFAHCAFERQERIFLVFGPLGAWAHVSVLVDDVVLPLETLDVFDR